MKYKNFLIVASKLDEAGMNIASQIAEFPSDKFKFYFVDKDILHEENLDMEKINKHDFIIFASMHKSVKKEKTLAVHAPGNFRLAEFGGKDRHICKTSALFQKKIFEKLNEVAERQRLTHYQITMEATHHGPLIDKPCLFVEIGSTEMEWKDKKAGFVVGKAISESIEEFEENLYHEIAVGIGGPHYCPNFNKMQLKSNFAISHIIPQYALPLTDEMIKQIIEKTDEEIDFVLLDWKGLGNTERRQEVIDILDKYHLAYKKTGGLGTSSETEEDEN